MANDWATVQADRSAHPGLVFLPGQEALTFPNLEILTEQLHKLFQGSLGDDHGSMS